MGRGNPIRKRPGFLIRRLQQIQVAAFLMECADIEITPVQWGILTTLAANAHPGASHGTFEFEGEEVRLVR